MFSTFSVKKPFYILAAAVIVLLLGGFSLSYMKTNLLPEMEVPYLAVITTDVGASPEQVENDVTNVLEGQLSTVSGVENVTSTSAENYSMIFLEFNQDTNMDSALVKVSAAVNQVAAELPDSAGTPSYMEMNMDSMASMYIGVSDSEKDIAQQSEYVNETLIPALERQEGVASVSAAGLITNDVNIELNQSKIDQVNNRILANVNSKLADSKAELDDAQAQLDSARAELDSQKSQLSSAQSSTEDQLAQATESMNTLLATKTSYESQLASQQAKEMALEAQYEAAVKAGDTATAAQIQAMLELQKGDIAITQAIIDGLDEQAGDALDQYTSVEEGKMQAASQFGSASAQISSAESQLSSSQSQLDSGWDSYNDARDQAIKSANIDQLLDVNTLSQLVSAQDFSMPAGYVKNEAGDQWMLKVGEKYNTVDQLSNSVLTTIDGVGDITLADVADITVINNVGENYAKLNGTDGLIIAVTKTSTASTSDVSKAIHDEIDSIQKDAPTLEVMMLSDQGKYINLYISTILQSLLIGALLAIIVLALFLRNIRPTLIVAFSIPFSVLFALVIMYFAGITINIMSLGALSLATGMLVDNSVVVMENIYRLRGRGLSAPRAAAQGAKQVTGAIVASTLTTICVFLPFIFTTGTVRQMMVPFALTISFALVASLIVALSVVPALGSKAFVKVEPKPHAWFEKLKDAYGHALERCLRHKAPVLIVAVALLAVCTGAVFRMGIVMIPEMSSNQISVTAEMPEGMDKATAYQKADEIAARIQGVEGIKEVGAADNSTTSSLMMSTLSESTDLYQGAFMIYAIPDDATVKTQADMTRITDQLDGLFDDFTAQGYTISTDASASMMSEMMGSGVQIDISGDDPQQLLTLSKKVEEALSSVEGYKEISNGQEEADATMHLKFDKNKVAQMGTTVAQIYEQLAGKLNATAKAPTLDSGTTQMNVDIKNNRNEVTVENLMETTFDAEKVGSDGSQTTETHKLSEVATVTEEPGVETLSKMNGVHELTVSAEIDDAHNSTLLMRDLQPKLDQIDVPSGYTVEVAGTDQQINDMVQQMLQLILLGAVLIYLIMMAQFQSFKSPFIIILTVPLAFTGGLIALLIAGEQLSMMSMLGFVVLMGTVVNNAIVFVDYVNKLRLGGMEKRSALIATGKTRMRPIMMTALTTILAMCAIIFNPEIGAGMQRGMALVVAGGLLYATFMTLFVVPIVYDLMNRKPMKLVDVGDDTDDEPDDAEAFIAQMGAHARARVETVDGVTTVSAHSEVSLEDEPGIDTDRDVEANAKHGK